MRVKHGWIFILSFICQRGISQIDTTWHHEVLFKTELTSLTPTFYPNLQLELELPVIGNSAVVLAGGPMVAFNAPAIVNGITRRNREGYFLNPSIKYYFKNHAGLNHFISLEGDYRICTYHAVDRFVLPHHPEVFYDDTIKVKNIARGFTMNYGVTYGWKHFGFEFIAGFGIMFNQNTFTEESHPDADFANRQWKNIWQRESFLMPRLPTRVLLYYRF